MTPVQDMLKDGASRQAVLKTMPKRSLDEQRHVWAEGLARMQQAITRAANAAANQLVEHVRDGAVSGLFYDPLDEAAAYVKDELRRSRSREEGERKRQQWLMDLLEKIGEARLAGAERLVEYPPAKLLMESAPVAEAA